MKAYKELVERGSQKEKLSDEQKAIIKEGWKRKREKKTTGPILNPEQEEERWANIFKEIQTFGTELKQILEMINQCGPSNVIHSSKMTRCGEAHKRLAQGYFAKAKGEVEKITKQKKSRGDDGGKHLSAAIGEQVGKPLTNVCRDRDTADGGKNGSDDQ